MQEVYQELARLFTYPGEDYHPYASNCVRRISSEDSKIVCHLDNFLAAIQGLSTDELQELFTRTFDLNPVCTLEIGWHLFGEDYKRGEFLVKMRQQLRSKDIPESMELPDHLTHALALLSRMGPDESAAFARQYVLPALDKMLAGWEKHRNAFAELLQTVFLLLKSRYSYEPARQTASVPALRVLQ